MASDVEPAKKVLLPYLQRADELQKHEPLVAYYCRLYAMERGLKIPVKERTKTTNAILVSLMNQLEKDKKTVQVSPDDNLYVEGFALSVFAKADKQDRAGRADLNTAKTFYAASIFIEVLHQFGPLQPDIEQRQKYAVWKAADIRKALSEGRKPVPGPPGGDDDLSISADASDSETRTENTASKPSQQMPQLQHTPSRTFSRSTSDIDMGPPSQQMPDLQHTPSRTFSRSTSDIDVGPNVYGNHAPKVDHYEQQYPSNNQHGIPQSPYDSANPVNPGYPSSYPSSYYPSPPPLPTGQYGQSDGYMGQPHAPHYNDYAQNPATGYSYPTNIPTGYAPNNGMSDAPYYQSQGGQKPSAVAYPASAPVNADYASFGGSNESLALDQTACAPVASVRGQLYQPPPDKISDAQKAARFAVSALAFDDVPTAVSYLEEALAMLTRPSHT